MTPDLYTPKLILPSPQGLILPRKAVSPKMKMRKKHFHTGGSPPAFGNTKSLTISDGSSSYDKVQGAGTSRRKMTFSFWLRTPSDASLMSFNLPFAIPSTTDVITFPNTGPQFLLGFGAGAAVTTTGFTPANSTWYNVIVQVDTTQATASNRVKIIINGVDYTDTGVSFYPMQNTDLAWGQSGVTASICIGDGATSALLDELAVFDNQTYTYSDVASGGKPKDLTGLTFGAQGYWIRFETGVASTGGNDSSGNGNNYTNNGHVNGDFSATVP